MLQVYFLPRKTSIKLMKSICVDLINFGYVAVSVFRGVPQHDMRTPQRTVY